MRRGSGWWTGPVVAGLLAMLVALPAHAQPKTLIIGQPTDAESVDPHKVTAVIAVERLYNLYDTLVNLDFDLEKITPGLAETWQVSPDGPERSSC